MSDYWAPRRFEVGEKVRIRLSLECPTSVPPLRDGTPNPIVVGHDPKSDGVVGEVVAYQENWEPHPYWVAYPSPRRMGERSLVRHFAAIELVPVG